MALVAVVVAAAAPVDLRRMELQAGMAATAAPAAMVAPAAHTGERVATVGLGVKMAAMAAGAISAASMVAAWGADSCMC